MKVVVRCVNNRVTKVDMKREIERLFQENKDLRVQVGHLHDELANAKASVEIQRGFREEMAEEIEALEKALAKSESESSQGMNAMVKFWEEAVNEKNKAEERAEEYRIAAMESDCRVDELEKRVEWLQNERQLYENNVEQLTYERDIAIKGNEELMAENTELRENLDAATNIRVEYAQEIDRLRKVVIELQTNRFTMGEIKNMICKYLENHEPSSASLNF